MKINTGTSYYLKHVLDLVAFSRKLLGSASNINCKSKMIWMTSPLPNRPTEPAIVIPKPQLLKGCHQDHLSNTLEKFQT
jgi:hypothetical protein